MNTKLYELQFVTDEIDDELLEKLMETGEPLTVSSHGRLTYVSIDSEGTSALAAARGAYAFLTQQGVHVMRLGKDLVSQGEIAIRADVTAACVSQWVKACSKNNFPREYDIINGRPVWPWCFVLEWLHNEGRLHDEEAGPTPDEVDRFNAELNSHVRPRIRQTSGDTPTWTPSFSYGQVGTMKVPGQTR